MSKREFWFSWSSSRYDRSLKLLREAVEFYLTKSILHGGTEVGAENREKVLRGVAREKGWGIITGDKSYRDDTYIMWDKDFWTCEHKGTYRIESSTMYNAAGNKMPDNVCTAALLVFEATGHRLLITAMHPPSGVEGPGGLTKNFKRGLAWRKEYKAWKKFWNRKAKQWEADAVMTAQDGNVNIRRPLFIAMFKSMQPGMRLVVPESGKKGTLHNRWIDFAFIRGKIKAVTKARLMRDDASSDHRPWKVKLRFKGTPKSKRKAKK